MNSTAFEQPKGRRWRLLPVLDRMLVLELTKTLLSVLAVLVTIIVSRKFLSILAKAIEGEIAGETLLSLLGLKVIIAFIMLMPPALFLAILMVFGRMYRDQEMSILSSGGVGYARLYRALAWFVIPMFVASAYLALVAVPWAEGKTQALMKKDEKTADLRGIKPGRFNEFSRGDVVLYAESLSEESGVMKKIFVQSRSGDKNGVTSSESGHLRKTEIGEHFVVLNNGVRYQGTPGRADYIISLFDEYAVKIDADAEDRGMGFKRESAESSLQLWKSGTREELGELQHRLAVPMGVFWLGILAVPISRVAPRSGVFGNVLTAFLIFVVYSNLQSICQGLLMNGKLSFWPAFSAAYVFMLILIVFNILRSLGVRWCWMVLRGETA